MAGFVDTKDYILVNIHKNIESTFLRLQNLENAMPFSSVPCYAHTQIACAIMIVDLRD